MRKRRHSLRQTAGKILFRSIAILSVIFISLMIGFASFRLWKDQSARFLATSSFARFATWFAERKKNLHHEIAQVKNLSPTNQQNDEPQIHFEFYSTLPNMQIEVPKEASETQTKVMSPKLPEKTFNPDQLEKEFAEEIHRNDHVVQKKGKHEMLHKINKG